MTSQTIPISQLKKFGGIRFKNAVIGTFTDGYNFEAFPAQDDGYGVKKMQGNTLLDDALKTLGMENCGVFESLQAGIKYTFVYAVNNTEGKLYEWDGSNFNLKKSGLTKTAKNCNGIDFNDKFFFTNGVEEITVKIGASPETTVISCIDQLSRTHHGLGLWVYDNRIWLISQYGLVSCIDGNETDWHTTGNAGAFYKDYEGAKAVYGFSSGIVISGPNFTEFMTGIGTENYSFATVGNTGAVGHKAICAHDNKIYFFNGEGIYPITYIDTNQRRIAERITTYIDDSFKTIDKTKYADVQLISLADIGENRIWFHARYTDYLNNSVIWILDYFTMEWFKRIQQPINYLSINSNALYSVSVAGELLEENFGSDFNGEILPALAKFAILDFGSMSQLKKRMKQRRCIFSAGSQNDFYLKDLFDGDPSNYTEYHVQEDLGAGLIWSDDAETLGGEFADDAETIGSSYDDLKTNNMEINTPDQQFYSIQMQIECREANQNFDIQRIEFMRVKVKV